MIKITSSYNQAYVYLYICRIAMQWYTSDSNKILIKANRNFIN